MAESRIQVAGASRPFPGESANGDAWRVDWHAGVCRIVLVDGLGHGPAAEAVARAASDALGAHPALDPLASLTLVHRALAGTRGAVASVASLDPEARQLTFAGVGNVEGRLHQHGRSHHPIVYRGVLGATLRTVRPFVLPLERDWLLVLYSDGVSPRLDVADIYAQHGAMDLATVAECVLDRWGRGSDDATVVLARPMRPV